MMIPIPVPEKPFVISLSLMVHYPLQLGLVVFDPSRTHTCYFKRKVNFKPNAFEKGVARRAIEIPMPISSKHLSLALFEKGSGETKGFELNDFDIQPMDQKEAWATPDRHRYMDFATQFAQKAGYLPPGYYPSRKHEFLIHYRPKLWDTFGNELVTPARIHRKAPCLQISKEQFKQFSIPVRVAILAHEGCHYFNDTRSEKEADLCGLRYYLDAGFPKIEAVYAITKVFRFFKMPIEKQHLQRARHIIDFIDHYRTQQAQPLSNLSEIK